MKRLPRITDEQREKAHAFRKEGKSWEWIGIELGVNFRSLRRSMQHHGYEMHGRDYTKAKPRRRVSSPPKEVVIKNMTRQRVAARWDMDFWDLIADFAYQGLNRSDTARAIGYRPCNFMNLLAANPRRDPFEVSSKPLAYLQDTDEPFGDAVRRMAERGMTVTGVARAIGYKSVLGLRNAMKARGIDVTFCRYVKKPKAKPLPDPPIARGWPTWEKVQEICDKR